VQLEGGNEVEYDWLVLAMGSFSDSRGIPGVKELAISFNDYGDAVKARKRICVGICVLQMSEIGILS
jgi:NADH dehydrogenase FAD-containing subunit